MATSSEILNARLNNAFNLPLNYRCEELTHIFEEFGSKELYVILPHVLENLFGLTNQVGWGLRSLYRNTQPCEFDILFRFLHPHGPLFRLCYKLLTDSYIKYQFPLIYLPVKVRKSIEDGMVPPFYIDKVQIDPQTRIPTSLCLNSFELYIFHFAYHLVNPWLQRTIDQGSWCMWETVYIHLAEEYLLHFLPCDGSPVPPYAGYYIPPKSSIPLQATSRPARSPTLFRQSVVLKLGSTSTSLHTSPTLPQQSSLIEIWRSETVIQVFIDFWLSYGEREMPYIGIGAPPRLCYSPVCSSIYHHNHMQIQPFTVLCQCLENIKPLTLDKSFPCIHHKVQPQSNIAFQHHPQNIQPVRLDKSYPCVESQVQPQSDVAFQRHPQPIQPVTPDKSCSYIHDQMQSQSNIAFHQYPEFLPSIEHIRVIRNLLKHLHYFANSVTDTLCAMDELKRIILPSSQSKIYGFLRHTIHHWPLDSSFRLILETWLSYIQPWRYTDWRLRNTRSAGCRDNEERVRVVDRVWLNFIAENLLAYTVIFRQLLPRFTRLDLATPKNAHMLFRVTKVFSQPNLNRMLCEIEQCLDDVSGAGLSNGSRRTPESTLRGHKWSAVVRQQVLELEGPGYQYKPMFGPEMLSQVFQFMMLIQAANETARNLQLHLESEMRNRSSSFFASLKDLLFSSTLDVDEYTLEERKKVSAYLETCLTQLSNIFEIDPSRLPLCGSYESSRFGTSTLQPGESSIPTKETSPPQSHTPVTALSPLDWKERSKCIRYEGDPDLEPIRTTENAFLVRLLYQITSKLNEMYTLEMCHLYDHSGLLGCMARQVLSPPMVSRTYDKSGPGGYARRIEKVLPPRLSLRTFASHRSIVYLLIGVGLAWMFGYGPTAFLFLLFSVWMLFIFVKGVFEVWFGSRTQNNNVGQIAEASMNRSDVSDF